MPEYNENNEPFMWFDTFNNMLVSYVSHTLSNKKSEKDIVYKLSGVN